MSMWDLQRSELLLLCNGEGAFPTAQPLQKFTDPPELYDQGHTDSMSLARGKGEGAGASSRPSGCHGLKTFLQHPLQHHCRGWKLKGKANSVLCSSEVPPASFMSFL